MSERGAATSPSPGGGMGEAVFITRQNFAAALAALRGVLPGAAYVALDLEVRPHKRRPRPQRPLPSLLFSPPSLPFPLSSLSLPAPLRPPGTTRGARAAQRESVCGKRFWAVGVLYSPRTPAACPACLLETEAEAGRRKQGVSLEAPRLACRRPAPLAERPVPPPPLVP